MKAEVIWKSPECTPAGDPFLTVKKARGYFYYAERGGIDSVAFIVYDRNTKMFGLINESKPPLDEMYDRKVSLTTAAGGSLDVDIPYEDIAMVECREEMGFSVQTERVHDVGRVLVSTQMSQECYCYLIDVTGLEPGDSEEDNELIWLTEANVMSRNDWKAVYIIAQAKYLGIL